MDPTLPTQSPDSLVVKPSFRKPSNDATNRKYRRHSPVGGSDSSSSGGNPYHEQKNDSPVFSKEDRTKVDDRRRRDEGRDLDRDSNRNRSDRGSDPHRHSDRQTYANHRDYRRHDDYNRHHRNADAKERNSQKSACSGRESRSSNHSDHTRVESYSDRSRDNYRNVDKYSRDKTDSGGHRNRDKEALAYHKHNDRDVSSERVVCGGRKETSYKDDAKSGERDRQRDRGERDEKREHHGSLGDCKNANTSSHEELRGHVKDSISGRDGASTRAKETYASSNKEIDRHDDMYKRKYDDRERDKCKEKYAREDEEEIQNDNRRSSSFHERDERKAQYLDKTTCVAEDQSLSKKVRSGHSEKAIAEDVVVDEKPLTSSKLGTESVDNANSQPVSSSTGQAEAAHDLNAAKVAAMKAAELVNRNLVGGGYMSTDQKKKLLWGNKKNTDSEESSNRWDLPLFSDRERQEKFNKLMGVKGDAKLEHKPDDKDGSLRAEKQEQLQMDLEKQYTAGLRRRDGRTVGLGL